MSAACVTSRDGKNRSHSNAVSMTLDCPNPPPKIAFLRSTRASSILSVTRKEKAITHEGLELDMTHCLRRCSEGQSPSEFPLGRLGDLWGGLAPGRRGAFRPRVGVGLGTTGFIFLLSPINPNNLMMFRLQVLTVYVNRSSVPPASLGVALSRFDQRARFPDSP